MLIVLVRVPIVYVAVTPGCAQAHYATCMKDAAVAVLALVCLLSASSPASACIYLPLNGDDVIENERLDTPDARFTLVVRRFESVGDFETTTAAMLPGFTPYVFEEEDPAEEYLPEDYEPYRAETPLDVLPVAPWEVPDDTDDDDTRPTVAALYRNLESGAREMVSTLTLAPDSPLSNLRVSEDGRFVVSWKASLNVVSTGCDSFGRDGIVIYDTSRDAYVRVEYEELFTESDYEWMHFGGFAGVSYRIRIMPNTRRLVLTLGLPPAEEWQMPSELDIDLETGTLLQAIEDLYPPMKEVFVEPSSGRATSSEGCEKGSVIAAVDSSEVIDRATYRPMPSYPEVAWRARITGTVIVEVVVAEDGSVSCTRVMKGLPFGLDVAAVDALSRWQFSTDREGQKSVPFSGVVDVRFQISVPNPR